MWHRPSFPAIRKRIWAGSGGSPAADRDIHDSPAKRRCTREYRVHLVHTQDAGSDVVLESNDGEHSVVPSHDEVRPALN